MSQPTSPTTSRKNLVCRVLMLDDTEEIFYVPNKSLGRVLFTKVVQKLQLLEADYFDLQYKNVEGILCWLDHEKPVTSHMPQNNLNFEFVVKFYTPDPGMLEEELTRYLFALQVKRDLATGQMPCQEQTAALLASYIIQAEFGDLTDEGYENAPDYLKSFKLFPNISNEMEARIIQHHREHFGQTPMDADYNLLDTARKVEFYGICMHNAKDHEGVALHLAVTHMGVVVFQNMTRINTFSWAKIRKLSFKRKKFLIKLHPEGYGFYKDTVEFYFTSRNECKNFWKKCLEHHAFFRCQSVKKIPRNKTRVVSHGSSFRYSGKTQKQLVDFVRENFSKRPSSFLRSTSMRTVNFGGAATPRTGTLRSLRHSHQPHHESPQPNEERSNQFFSPVKHDHCSAITFQHSGFSEPTCMPTQKNTHTLPKESKSFTSNGNGKKQTRSKELEKSQQILSKAEEKKLLDLGLFDNSQNSVLELLRTQKTINEEDREEKSSGNKVDSIPLSMEDTALDHNDTNVPALTSSLHQQFQLFHEIQKHPQQSNCLPISFTAHFPLYPSTSAISVPTKNILISDGITATPVLGGFSKSLSIQLSGSLQPRYLCTDIDSCELPMHHSEGSVDSKTCCSSSNNKPFPFQIKTIESNPIIASDIKSNKCLETMRLPTNQQQNNHHSTISLSKNENSANFSTHGGTKVFSTHLFEAEPMTLSNDLINSCIQDSNPHSIDLWLTSGTNDESVLPIRDQALVSNDADIKKVICIPGYYIGKELLMTERTYRRDLEIMVEGFQWMLHDLGYGLAHPPPQNSHIIQESLQLFKPIYQIHTDFLQSIETRIIKWENLCTCFEDMKMGDLFALNISMLRLYSRYFSNEEELLKKLYTTLHNEPQFRLTFQKFETSKTCYQPFSAFLLKPYQRLQHYEYILNKFIEVCGEDHDDLENCEESKIAILDIITTFKDTHSQMINLQKLCELQHYIAGIGDLISLRPQFIREGCLQMLSDNGYHQRLFILFDDYLVCANRRPTGNFQFIVHAHIPTENIQIEVFRKVNTCSEKDNQSKEDTLINNGFLIRVFGSSSHIIEVAASSTAEKNKWLEDLNAAVSFARTRRETTSRKNFFDSMETILINNSEDMSSESKQLPTPTLPLSPVSHPYSRTLMPFSSSLLQQQHLHTNTMMFVCWHRNTSICLAERRVAVKNCLSGFLLRKFKTSLGWQKLWVIFSNLCLFFYKSYKDEYPLASLPLLGYSISLANQSDGINKNFVFKLTFKSHAYFFRAESKCTFERWMEMIGSTIEYSQHFRLFSRVDSFVGVNST